MSEYKFACSLGQGGLWASAIGPGESVIFGKAPNDSNFCFRSTSRKSDKLGMLYFAVESLLRRCAPQFIGAATYIWSIPIRLACVAWYNSLLSTHTKKCLPTGTSLGKLK